MKNNSNPAWQEIEVDNLMKMDEVADSSISKRFLNVTWKGKEMKHPTYFEKITYLVKKALGLY